MNEQPIQLETDRLNAEAAGRGSPDPAHDVTAGLPEIAGDLRSGQRAESGDPRPTTPPPSSSDAPVPPPAAEPLTFDQIQDIEKKIVEALKSCFDPEIPVNIYEMGLIYNIDIEPTGIVNVRMTLTSPACPAAGSLPPEVRWKVQEIPGVKDAKVEIVWDPPWTKDRMSEAARLQLGIFD